MVEDRLAVLKYKPIIMKDKKEPFDITAMGYTVFRETKQSDSFPKRVVKVENGVQYVIEYAIWYDFDIQHLYELEHVWVYVGSDGSVLKVEGSFHGKYLNMVDLDTGEAVVSESVHPVVFAQPGKHALVPEPRVIRMIPGWRESCLEEAGEAGVLVQDMFRDSIRTDEELQVKTQRYIRENYGFVPSMEFEPFIIEDSEIMTWEELKETIPLRVNKQIEKIREWKS